MHYMVVLHCVCASVCNIYVLWNEEEDAISLSVSAHSALMEPLTAPAFLQHHRLSPHTQHHVIAL